MTPIMLLKVGTLLPICNSARQSRPPHFSAYRLVVEMGSVQEGVSASKNRLPTTLVIIFIRMFYF